MKHRWEPTTGVATGTTAGTGVGTARPVTWEDLERLMGKLKDEERTTIEKSIQEHFKKTAEEATSTPKSPTPVAPSESDFERSSYNPDFGSW